MRQSFEINDLSKKWMLEHFEKNGIAYNEPSMISVLKDEKSSIYSKQQAGVALREIGTNKSLKALENCIHHANEDLQAISILTIAQIGKNDSTEFFLSLLKQKRIQIAYVLWALFAIDDKESVHAIERFVESKMKIDKRPSSKKLSHVHHGIVMIENYGKKSEIRTEILDFYNSNWEKLDIQQKNILKNNTEFFKNK
jgi:hypothetical protein